MFGIMSALADGLAFLEMKTKPSITAKIEGDDSHPVDKVAATMVEGMY